MSPFTILGNDVINEVSLYLPVEDFVSFQRVCKDIYFTTSKIICIQRSEAQSRQITHKAIVNRESFFLSGPPGVGKTYTISKIIDQGTEKGLNVVPTSPTGISTTHIPGGVTLHSLMGRLWTFSIDQLESRLGNGDLKNLKFYKSLKNIDVLIIDEISMVGANLFDKLELLARYSKENDKIMGGMQIICVGDFFQLPPVCDKYIFRSKKWKELSLPTIEMNLPVRQHKDICWFNLLNRIREKKVDEIDIQKLQSKLIKTDSDTLDIIKGKYGVILTPKNSICSYYNKQAFDMNPSRICDQFNSIDKVLKKRRIDNRTFYDNTGDMSVQTAIKYLGKKLDRTEEQVKIKNGALYVLTINIDIKRKMVNGTQCIYNEDTRFFYSHDGELLFDINFIVRKRKTYFLKIHGDYYFQRKQIPLKLAHSLTIHSSQGMTLEKVVIDAGKNIFNRSMLYVAFSRLSSFEGLTLLELDERKIKQQKTTRKKK